jgi:hypothetical protein
MDTVRRVLRTSHAESDRTGTLFAMQTLLQEALQLLLGPTVLRIRCADDLAHIDTLGSPPVFSLSPSHDLEKKLRHKGYTYVRHFVAIPSHNMPRWLLPIGNVNGTLAAATQIYMPHKRMPQALKGVFLRIAKLGWTGWLRPRVLLASKGPLWIEDLVHAVTEEQSPIFALSFGRQAAVRKLTVQVMRSSVRKTTNGGMRRKTQDIIGYMKLPLTDVACKRVRHEAATLAQLWNFPPLRRHIPRLLYSGDWNDTFVLFQSPLEGSLGPTRLNGLHTQFLQALWSVHRVEKPGKILIHKVGKNWETVSAMLGAKWDGLAREVLAHATRTIGDKMLPFGVMHGDFAPWNTRVSEKELLLFDWESADWEAPTTWDISHFEVLTASSSLRIKGGHQTDEDPSGGVFFMLYLLNSVCQFVQEGNGEAVRYREELLAEQFRCN